MTNNINLKVILLKKCAEVVEEQLSKVQTQIKDIQESLSSETKSSAGDKHETGRAMIQLEREKAGNRLAEIEKTHAVLSKIDASKSVESLGLGSIVFTDKANYFIAVSAGQIEVDGTKFYAVSSASPIGQALIGRTNGNLFKFRGQEIMIKEVY